MGNWSLKARLATAAGIVVGAASLAIAGLWLFGRPSVSVSLSGAGLIRVELGGVGAHLSGVGATVGGKPLGLVNRNGGLVPSAKVSEGEAVHVTAAAAPPSWLGWLLGHRVSTTKTLSTPTAAPAALVVFAPHSGDAEVNFDHPVSVVEYTTGGATQTLRLGSPSTTVEVPVPAQARGGRLKVAAAPLHWEAVPSHATTLTWFATSGGNGPLAVADPTPGSETAAPNSPISVTFSQPVSQVLGGSHPRVSPAVPGAWSEPDANTLVFTPSGFGFGPSTAVKVTFDRPVSVIGSAGITVASVNDTYSFTTTPGSVLRLEQILAQLHYLPLDFVPAAGQSVPTTFAAEVDSMSHPLAGRFQWRWASTPASLESQWTVGTPNVLVKGALMAFDASTQRSYDGYQVDPESVAQIANAQTWKALLEAAVQNKLDPRPYSYVFVSQSLPQSLTLWENGSVVLTAAVNTGIAQRPTANGTFPIYVRYTFNYMSGFNPDGSYYHDPVYWINYFNGGDAVHGFARATYGWPQSLGCVELPIPTAQVAFNHLAIGDLVTVVA